MTTQQNGFSAIEAIIGIAVVVLLAAGGFAAWKAQHANNQSSSATDGDSPKKQVSTKEYTNTEYGFSFKYPDNWVLKVDLEDRGRGGNEGEISVTAPSGTKVHFNPHKGGRSGDCVPDASDRPDFTKSCATLRILSTEKTNGSSNEKPIYLTRRQITESIERGSNPIYFIALTTTDESLKVGTPFTGYSGIASQDLTIEGKGYVKASITDGDNTAASYGTDKNYFDTKRVKEGVPILESFRLL